MDQGSIDFYHLQIDRLNDEITELKQKEREREVRILDQIGQAFECHLQETRNEDLTPEQRAEVQRELLLSKEEALQKHAEWEQIQAQIQEKENQKKLLVDQLIHPSFSQ